MMMNNIRVSHNGVDVSVAQHLSADGRVLVQEIATIDDWHIERFGGSLDSLIETLVSIRNYLDGQN